MSTALEIRDSTSISVERYAILLLDAETGEVLDHTRMGGFDHERARSIVNELLGFLSSLGTRSGLGKPVEVDIVLEEGYLKILVEDDAELVRALVSRAHGSHGF